MGNMYSDYFGIKESAFSITPDPRFLFRSERHCEALAHLLYGVVESGCFVLLTGEVGTGKTTICRTLLEQLPENVDIALLLNPPQTGRELLLAINDELHIQTGQRDVSLHELVYILTRRLLENHSQGRRTVVIIDEAQTIAPDVLEQVRLLTNLETRTEKLLHVFLVGQPELRELLKQPSLRQVAQRITARYHLEPLTEEETRDYICHRLSVAGCRNGLFSEAALHQIYRESKGIPRIINILCDRALLGAFACDQPHVSSGQIHQAARQWRGEQQSSGIWSRRSITTLAAAAGLLSSAALVFAYVDNWPAAVTEHALAAVLGEASPSNAPPQGDAPQAPPPTAATAPAPASAPSAASISVPRSTPANMAAVPFAAVTGPLPAAVTPVPTPLLDNSPELPRGIQVIGPGSPPQAVRWLRSELDRIEGISSAENGPLFDNELRSRVMKLQHSHGLVADGLVGPHTLHFLQVLYGTSVVPAAISPQPRS